MMLAPFRPSDCDTVYAQPRRAFQNILRPRPYRRPDPALPESKKPSPGYAFSYAYILHCFAMSAHKPRHAFKYLPVIAGKLLGHEKCSIRTILCTLRCPKFNDVLNCTEPFSSNHRAKMLEFPDMADMPEQATSLETENSDER